MDVTCIEMLEVWRTETVLLFYFDARWTFKRSRNRC